MKRTLAITLTVALIGSLMFMGFAGTAAADDQSADQGTSVNQYADANNYQDQKVAQSNYNVGDELNIAVADDGSADAGSSVDQSNTNSQDATAEATNDATVSQDIEQSYEDDFFGGILG